MRAARTASNPGPLVTFLHLDSVFAAWALAEAVSSRLLPLWVNAGGTEFSWEWTLMAVEANIQLVRSLRWVVVLVTARAVVTLDVGLGVPLFVGDR